MKLYGVRHRKLKTFSNGGSTPNFTSGGKFWSGPSAFKNHLNQAISASYGSNPVEVIFVERFEPYLESDLIIFDTETLTGEFDDNFMYDYFKKTAQTKYHGYGYSYSQKVQQLFDL